MPKVLSRLVSEEFLHLNLVLSNTGCRMKIIWKKAAADDTV